MEKMTRKQTCIVYTVVTILFVGVWFLPKTPEQEARQEANQARQMRKQAAEEAERSERDHEIMVRVKCESAIKSALRAPATADFPWQPVSIGRLKSDGSIMRVLTYVDAQNSFGATIRTNFLCDCKQVNEKWAVVELKNVGG